MILGGCVPDDEKAPELSRSSHNAYYNDFKSSIDMGVKRKEKI